MQNAEQVQTLLESCQARGLRKAATVEQIAAACLGWPYVFGALGEMCTPKNRDRRSSSAYPSIVNRCQVLNGSAKTCEGCQWGIGVRMFDCRGFTCCVFKCKDGKMSHTGLCLGHGNIIQCSTTVKRGKTTDAGWTHYAIPKGLYTDEELAAIQDQPIHPTLRKGDVGESVRQMQALLIAAGFPCGNAGADGIFGQGTLAAVKSFQQSRGLIVDGIVGPATWAALDMVPDQPPAAQYIVHIPHLDKTTAEALAAVYDGAYITGEGE